MRTAKELGIEIEFKEMELKKLAVKSFNEKNISSINIGDNCNIDQRYYRPAEVETLLGDPSKAKEKLGCPRNYSSTNVC